MRSRILALTTALTLLVSPLASQAKDLTAFAQEGSFVHGVSSAGEVNFFNLEDFGPEDRRIDDLSLSPDQTRLAYICANETDGYLWTGELKIAELGKEIDLSYKGVDMTIVDCPNVQRFNFDDYNLFSLDWGPNGRLIVADGMDRRIRSNKVQLYLIDTIGGTIDVLHTGPSYNMNPTWGDDNRIYFETIANKGLAVLDLRTRKVSAFGKTSMEWENPDACEAGIVFSSKSENGTSNVYLADYDGRVRGLVDDGIDHETPRWSTDCETVFYDSGIETFAIDIDKVYEPWPVTQMFRHQDQED
ncbi:MAG: hypothetical protein KKH88_01910 [Nanoarchaeota archaeon]|nr:hypothetical protein [Nanoarchaeota archaeon]